MAPPSRITETRGTSSAYRHTPGHMHARRLCKFWSFGHKYTWFILVVTGVVSMTTVEATYEPSDYLMLLKESDERTLSQGVHKRGISLVQDHVINSGHSPDHACNMTFDPTDIALDEYDVSRVNYSVLCALGVPPASQISTSGAVLGIHVSMTVVDDTIATIEGADQFNHSFIHDKSLNDAYHLTSSQDVQQTSPYNTFPPSVPPNSSLDPSNIWVSGSFHIRGIQFGRTIVRVTLAPMTQTGNTPFEDVTTHDVVVKKEDTLISLIYLVVVGVMIVLYNFGFGCKVKVELILQIVKKPVAPAIGFCCQFLVMSPLSFGVAKLLNLSDEAGMGLLAIGSAPGGGGSNVFAFLLKGDLELSITMTFLSTVASLGMTPLWIWALGRYFTGGQSKIKIPVANVFSSLAIVTIPVILGILVNKFKPRVAEKIAWCLKPATAVIGAVFISLGVYVYYSALVRVSWQTLVACIVVSFCGYSIGASAGKIFRQKRPRWLTISLETGFQNLALSLMIIGTSLESPESDLAGVVPVCYTFLSAAMPSIAFIIKFLVAIHRGDKPWKSSDSLDISPIHRAVSVDSSPSNKYEVGQFDENCAGVKMSTISAKGQKVSSRDLGSENDIEGNGNVNNAMDHGKENGHSAAVTPSCSVESV